LNELFHCLILFVMQYELLRLHRLIIGNWRFNIQCWNNSNR
jgi:hypothetical protein